MVGGEFSTIQKAPFGDAPGARRELSSSRGVSVFEFAGARQASDHAAGDFESVLRESRLRQPAPEMPGRSDAAHLERDEGSDRVSEPRRPEASRRREDRQDAQESRETEADQPHAERRADETEERAEVAAAAAQPLAQIPGETVVEAEAAEAASTAIQNGWVVNRLVQKGGDGRAQVGRTTAGDGLELTPQMLQQAAQLSAQNETGRDSGSFDLLDFQELMDPDLEIDSASDEMLERLQQALANGAASVEEMGEVVLPQVVRGLATLVRGNGVSELRMQLKPADLGEIELRVRAVEGLIRGEILVQTPELKNLLESQMDKLRLALSQHGLKLEGFDVNVAGQDRGRETGEEPPGWGAQRMAGRDATGAQGAEPAATVAMAPRGDSEVDYLV